MIAATINPTDTSYISFLMKFFIVILPREGHSAVCMLAQVANFN